MEAVILAAGRGRRLFPGSNALPKGLLPVGRTTILAYQIERCRENGIDPIHVVVGFQADLVRDTLGKNIDYVENAEFAETNSLYSYWLASNRVDGDVIVMNADVLFHPQILTSLIAHPRPNLLAADFRDSFEDEDMKIRAAHRHFNFPFLNDGETQEVARKYGPVATPHVFVFDRERKLRYEGRVDSNPREAYAKVPDARNGIFFKIFMFSQRFFDFSPRGYPISPQDHFDHQLFGFRELSIDLLNALRVEKEFAQPLDVDFFRFGPLWRHAIIAGQRGQRGRIILVQDLWIGIIHGNPLPTGAYVLSLRVHPELTGRLPAGQLPVAE